MPRPNFSFERAVLKRLPGAIVAGVDEAGCGPLAGPVVAAAVILDIKNTSLRLRRGLDDSKKLSPARREEFYGALFASDAAVIGIGQADVGEVDSLNILNAAHLAMARAVASLKLRVTVALVDGNRAPRLDCEVRTIIGGDAKSLSIAAASIIAKVTRDRLMTGLARAHPGYGWESNMGYGTAAHCEAIERLGLTPHHRRSFAPVRSRLDRGSVQIDLI
ncbi:MAG: ribonuclease HII [Rhodospirillaceae bacterium]|nr:ribonuclease HII [Rhodospirillaceae bacterium]